MGPVTAIAGGTTMRVLAQADQTALAPPSTTPNRKATGSSDLETVLNPC